MSGAPAERNRSKSSPSRTLPSPLAVPNIKGTSWPGGIKDLAGIVSGRATGRSNAGTGGLLSSLGPKTSRPSFAWDCAQVLSDPASAGSDVGSFRQVRPDGRRTWQNKPPPFSMIPAGSFFVFIGRKDSPPRGATIPPTTGGPTKTPPQPGPQRTRPTWSTVYRVALFFLSVYWLINDKP